MGKRDPTLKERMLFLINPQKANLEYNRRLNADDKERRAKRGGGTPRMSYGNHGASQTLNSMVG